MKKPKVIISYVKLKPAEQVQKNKDILHNMDGNVNFPNPLPTVVEYAAGIVDFDRLILEASSGDRNAIARLDTQAKKMIQFTRNWGQYVNSVSEGNIDKLTSSGFTLARLPQPIIITTPVNLALLQGLNPGSMVFKFKRVKGATGYFYEWTKDPAGSKTVWQSSLSSRSKQQFDNLEEGKLYRFRVTALGARDQVAISNEISQFVMQRSQDTAA